MTKDHAKERLRAILGEMLRRVDERDPYRSWSSRMRELEPAATACADVLGLAAPLEFGEVVGSERADVVTWRNPWTRAEIIGLAEGETVRDQVAQCLRDTRAALDADLLPADAEPPTNEDLGDPFKAPVEQLVRLSQVAGLIGREKRTLENWKSKDPTFPPPDVVGATGQPHLWRWSHLRAYFLARRCGRDLPERFPGAEL